jgi:hypothetical protein
MSVAVTTAAEGFPRRAFTVDDISRMIEAGIIHEDEKFELVEGEIVMRAPKDVAHERIKSALMIAAIRALPDHLTIGVETTLRLTNTIMIEPGHRRISQGAVREIRDRVRATRPRRSPPCYRGCRLEHFLRQGSQGTALCAPSRQGILGRRRQRAHHLGAHRPDRRRMVVDRRTRSAGCAHHSGVARLFDPARRDRLNCEAATSRDRGDHPRRMSPQWQIAQLLCNGRPLTVNRCPLTLLRLVSY